MTSATPRRSHSIETPFGVFAYLSIPLRVFMVGVERVESGGGQAYFLATPLKALADYVYKNNLNWTSTAPLVESLRIDLGDLRINKGEIDALIAAYPSKRVAAFLSGVAKELAL